MKPPPEVLLAILTDLSMDHRCFKEAAALRAAGFQPVILCDKPRHPLGRAWDGFDIRQITSVSHLDRFGIAFLLFHLRLVFALLTTRSRIWISLDCPPLLTLALLGKWRGATVIYDSHELFTETPMVLSRPSRRRFWTFWHNAGVSLVSHVIAVSPACLKWFARRYPHHQLLLLPNAPLLRTDLPVAAPPAAGEKPRLFFQGGLRVASGLSETFAAMRALPGWSLEAYGDGPERRALQDSAKQAGVDQRVTFHGQVPFEALRAPMAQAHIGVHLMQPVCDSFALTLANKLFDYLHAGLPVLLSDNESHRAFLAEFPVGVAVDSFSPEAIAEGLRSLAANWEAHHQACLRAREVWHWHAFAGKLPAFLTGVTPA